MRDHFDEIAAGYDSELPAVVRMHLLRKKCDLMHRRILAHTASPCGCLNGLDVGCGTGHHMNRMSSYGYQMRGIDTSAGMLAQARRNSIAQGYAVVRGSALALPFEGGSFDFAYSINVLHHLRSREEQREVLREMARVVKPGGLCFIHEINADTAVFRFYMNVIFPLTNRIDGDRPDLWVPGKWFKAVRIPGMQFQEVFYFTFIPNTLPESCFSAAIKIEALLERLTAGRHGAHGMFVLRRQASPRG